MATPRGALIRLLDAHPWTTPGTLLDAQRFHATLEPLRDTARSMHGRDRIARLVALRLELFLAHWPTPPMAARLADFLEDAAGLVEHDIPRLRDLLTWAPSRLPSQRSPRLSVASLHTA